MYYTHFDQRRPLEEPVGMPSDFVGTTIKEDVHRALLEEAGVANLVAADPTPIPAMGDRENYYADRHLEYWLSGLLDFRKVMATLPDLNRPARYLDIGGSTGRVVRHAFARPDLEVWVSDINVNWIDWIDKHFAFGVRAFQSRIHPHLPIEDGYFSLISGFSVFTHMDTDEVAWLLELRRVLAPGGVAYLTINDEGVWDLLSNENWAWLRGSMSRGNRDEEFRVLCSAPLAGERLVWAYSEAESYNINTFLRRDYVVRKWSQFFEVLEVRPFYHGYQTVVMLRKP